MKLEVNSLTKAYGGKPVLQQVSFTAEAGITALRGASGAGKTTLLRILLGLETADAGTVHVPAGTRWSAAFQEDRLLPGRTAEENLRFALGKDYDPAAAAELLRELALDPANRQSVDEWSGGMRRRLSLARALLLPADILVLDEPFAGLDEENHRRALRCVTRYAEKHPVIMATHDPADETACTTVVRIGE